jgi:hypothetical protein
LYNSYFPRLFFFLNFANLIISSCISIGKLCKRLVSFAATAAANAALAAVGDSALGDAALPVAALGDAALPVAALGDAALPVAALPVAALGDRALPVAALGDSALPVATLGVAAVPAARDDELDDVLVRVLRGLLLGDNRVFGIYYLIITKKK